jgi:hypothetical protein
MKKSIKFLFISLMAVFIGTYSQSDVFAHADHDKDAIIIQMADIMINLEHFPTADEKKKLQSVLDSVASTDQEKIIANAIMHIQHSPTVEDKDKLQLIMDNTVATSTVNTLAKIVQSFSHGISKTDKRKLQTIKFKG